MEESVSGRLGFRRAYILFKPVDLGFSPRAFEQKVILAAVTSYSCKEPMFRDYMARSQGC